MIISRSEAIEYLNLDEKIFDNYFKNACEFSCQPRYGDRGRFYFDTEDLDDWINSYRWRSVELDKDDYSLCLDFALAQHFRSYVLSDWGTGRQREFGQKVTNWVKGQLGEVALKKFLKREFDVDIELDFDIHEDIVPQDVISVEINGKMRQPSINIGIKSSKPKSAYLVLSPNEVDLPERRSDVYVFCRPNIADDHLLRVARNEIIKLVEHQPLYGTYMDSMPSFESIGCDVAGFCWVGELDQSTGIPGQDFDGMRYVKQTGKLHRSKADWQALVNKF